MKGARTTSYAMMGVLVVTIAFILRGGADAPERLDVDLDEIPALAALPDRDVARSKRPGRRAESPPPSRLALTTEIELRVVDDENRRPVEGALVFASSTAARILEPSADEMIGVTDSKGVVVLSAESVPALEGETHLCVYESHFEPAAIDLTRLAGADPGIEVALTRYSSYRVEATDPRGEPLAGVHVLVSEGAFPDPHALPSPDADGIAIPGFNRQRIHRAVTDEEGAATVYCPRGVQLRVRFWHRDYIVTDELPGGVDDIVYVSPDEVRQIRMVPVYGVVVKMPAGVVNFCGIVDQHTSIAIEFDLMGRRDLLRARFPDAEVLLFAPRDTAEPPKYRFALWTADGRTRAQEIDAVPVSRIWDDPSRYPTRIEVEGVDRDAGTEVRIEVVDAENRPLDLGSFTFVIHDVADKRRRLFVRAGETRRLSAGRYVVRAVASYCDLMEPVEIDVEDGMSSIMPVRFRIKDGLRRCRLAIVAPVEQLARWMWFTVEIDDRPHVFRVPPEEGLELWLPSGEEIRIRGTNIGFVEFDRSFVVPAESDRPAGEPFEMAVTLTAAP